MLDERSLKLMHSLVKRNHHFVPELMEQLNISRRQLEYALEKINQLMDLQYPLILENQYIVLTHVHKENLLNILAQSYASIRNYTMNAHEREKYLFLLLFYYHDRYFSLHTFISELKVSKTTILNDIRNLTNSLKQEKIAMAYSRQNGYHLISDELSIRSYLIKMILQDLHASYKTLVYDIFIEKEQIRTMQVLKNAIPPLLKTYALTLFEIRLLEFSYTFTFLKPRLNLVITEKYQQFQQPTLIQMKEYAFSQQLLNQFNSDYTHASLYLSAWLLGLSSERPDVETKDYATIIALVRQVILRFESLSGIRLSSHQAVIDQLYPHLRSAYYRIYFKLPIINPLREKIKEEYTDLFYLVKEALKPITLSFEQVIPEDEVAFLTMHFASLTNELSEKPQKSIVALIVCPAGIGSSSIVCRELEILFPEFTFMGPMESQKIENFTNSYDLIFSTVPNVHLFHRQKPVYVVHSIMSRSEKYRLVQDVYSHIGSTQYALPNIPAILHSIKKYTKIHNMEALERELYETILHRNHLIYLNNQILNLDQLINQDLIQLKVITRSWQEAIRLAAAPLLKQNRITRGYVEKMIQDAKEERSYMVISKQVALPHAHPSNGVLDLGISVTTLRDPINFGNEVNDPVKYLFCLAGTSDLRHLNAMNQLVGLLGDPKFYKLLDSSQSAEEIYKYIVMMIKKEHY